MLLLSDHKTISVIEENTNELKQCQFPFVYEGTTITTCTSLGEESGKTWCSTKVDPDTREHVKGFWGYCIEELCGG